MISTDNILKYLQEGKVFLLEFIKVVKDLLNIIWQHKVIVSIIVLIFLFYELLNYLAYSQPKNSISKYYHYVDSHSCDKAWEMLSPEFRASRWKGLEEFIEGYSTAGNTQVVSINLSRHNSLLDDLMDEHKEVEVEIIVTEHFNKAAIFDSCGLEKFNQRDNILFLKLNSTGNPLNALKNDTLKNFNESLKLTRRFKKLFSMKSDKGLVRKFLHSDWTIYDIRNKEIAIKYF